MLLICSDESERLERDGGSVRIWFDLVDGEPEHMPERTQSDDVWDRRDFLTNRFGGSRRITQALVRATDLPREAA